MRQTLFGSAILGRDLVLLAQSTKVRPTECNQMPFHVKTRLAMCPPPQPKQEPKQLAAQPLFQSLPRWHRSHSLQLIHPSRSIATDRDRAGEVPTRDRGRQTDTQRDFRDSSGGFEPSSDDCTKLSSAFEPRRKSAQVEEPPLSCVHQ